MFVFGNIIIGIAEVLNILLTVYMWIIVVRALISWVNPDPYNAIVQMLTRITEPVLARIRKLVPPWKIGLDLSPLIAVLIIIFLKYAVVSTLLRIGQSMG
ncbi:MAG: YggT family protein [Nitrospirota bacterium]